MSSPGRLKFILVAVVFHLIYVYSIFDIYFVSPIVGGMREFSPEFQNAPADRLVLFVGDGLRADKAFQSFPDPSPNDDDVSPDAPRPLAPFLRSKVLSDGTFGVSHTRVPTESRPGHVALIAGLYEDVSAVMTGWKLNPVNFDSVFNQSRHTWSWGSPDILPMFKEGAVHGRIDAYTYGSEFEDFTQDALQLDIWVFDHVKEFFTQARTNTTLESELRQDKLVFFLHLLGLDTNGHAYRPYSKEYLNNIKVVDEGIREITKLIDDFFEDERTAYIFTADHGMSDWGSHGDGHPDNTRTPLIAWGSGVAKPVKSDENTLAKGHEDGFSSDWGLSHVNRHDVAQADIAALMAYLAGLAFPVNSVGKLPLPYLACDSKSKAEALLTNAKGILEMYRAKEEQKMSTELRYVPFAALGDSVSTKIASIQNVIDRGNFEEAILMCDNLISTTLEGLRYLQTYDWLFLRTLVTIGYLGWIAYAATTLIDLHVLHGSRKAVRSTASLVSFTSVLTALFSILYVQKSALTYYGYAVFPVMFWEEVYAKRFVIYKVKDILLEGPQSANSKMLILMQVVAYVGVLEALVQSYFYRQIFSICYILAIFWPFCYGKEFVHANKSICIFWGIACSVMSVFTLLSANKVEDITLILLGGGLMSAAGIGYMTFGSSFYFSHAGAPNGKKQLDEFGISRSLFGLQIGLILLSMLVTKSSVASLQAREGLPLGTQVVGWLVLVISLAVPLLHGFQPSGNYVHRLAILYLTFAPTFVILTISYEGLFYIFFCCTLFIWIHLENKIHVFKQLECVKTTSRPATTFSANGTGYEEARRFPKDVLRYRSLTLNDCRVALFFLFLLQSAFFSTGNIASVSSFSLDAVYRLIPIFDPFSQGALLILKILIPFAVISANLGILNRKLGVAPSALFMIVMAMGDVMTLNFFFMVRDEGSWLEIGTTISHFCVASGLCVFLAGLESTSEIFVNGLSFESTDRDFKNFGGSFNGKLVSSG